MEKPHTKVDYAKIEVLVANFCNIILTKKDELNFQEAKQFIDKLTKKDKAVLNLEEPENDAFIRSMLQVQITKYLDSYSDFSDSNGVKRPFEFDGAGKYKLFCENCKKCYKRNNANAPFPPILEFALKYIQEMSEHYRIFSSFYDVRSKETALEILENVKKEAADKANEAVKTATEESAKKAVESAVEEKMKEVTKDISETSVTILGIFAGIVLTIVAGLFYSSSVIDNINSASIYKLISVIIFLFVFFVTV